LHEKSNGNSHGKEESASLNKKAIAAIVASTIRKTAAHIHKKRVQKEKAVSKEKDAVNDEDYAAILAACMFAPVKTQYRGIVKQLRVWLCQQTCMM
jgi:hypothetical protein